MSEVVISKKTYVLVWGSLLSLLGITVAAAYVHLGRFNAGDYLTRIYLPAPTAWQP